MRLALVAGRVPQSYVDQLDQIGESTGKCHSEMASHHFAMVVLPHCSLTHQIL